MKKISALAIAGVFATTFAANVYAAEVKVGGEIRVRSEHVDNKTETVHSRSLTLQRTRVNVDAKLNETSKAYIQLQDSRHWGSDGAATEGTGTDNADSESVDVKQAWFQLDKLFGAPLSLKAGRQVMAYGDHRVVGGFEWSNTARSFDAVKLMLNTEAVSVDAWHAKVTESVGNDTTDFKATTTATAQDDDTDFNGVYATIKVIPNNALDVYYLQSTNGLSNHATKIDVRTYGVRFAGKASVLDYAAEAVKQTGDFTGNLDVDTKAYAVKAGVTIADAAGLRIGGEYTYGSGDRRAGDNEKQDFIAVYPTNHPLYGYTDDIAWTNTDSWSVNASIKPIAGLFILAEYWDYGTAENVTKANKLTGAAIAGTTTDNAGTEVSLTARYKVNDNVALEAAWIRRENDDASVTKDYYGRAIAADDASTFSYVQANVTF